MSGFIRRWKLLVPIPIAFLSGLSMDTITAIRTQAPIRPILTLTLTGFFSTVAIMWFFAFRSEGKKEK